MSSRPVASPVHAAAGLVKRRAFLAALEGRLEAPLRAAGQLPAMTAFARQFDAANFRKGLQIEFTAGGGRLTTVIDGRQVRARLAALCWLAGRR